MIGTAVAVWPSKIHLALHSQYGRQRSEVKDFWTAAQLRNCPVAPEVATITLGVQPSQGD